MDRAIVLEHGRETIVFAEEYASGYKKPYARATDFRCPCCHQRLFFAEGKTQVPHFRHKKNNPRAKQCEWYVSAGMGGETLPVRVPPPLFIRQKVGMPGTFVIELGLKSPQEPPLFTLEKEGAVLSVANGMLRPKEYRVTAERFASGWLRVPLRVGRGFSFFDNVRLTHSERKFAEVWGMPKPIEDVLFFSCDRQTLSGRRIGSSGRIAIDDSVLIVSEFDTSYFSDFFSDIEKVGHAQACSSGSLNVFIATVGGASVDLLAKHEIVLTSRAEVPELLWPPALTSSGETRPLFSRSDCLYRLKQPSGGPETHETPFVRSDTTTDALRLERTCGKQWGSVCVHLGSDVTFITTDAWGPTLAILLKHKESQEPDGLRDSGMLPRIKCLESGEFEVSALSPCKVMRLYKGGHIERFGLEPGAVQVISNESRELVRIVLDAVLGIHGKRIVFELIPDVVEVVDACQESQQLKQPVGLGRDMAFARSRAVSIHSINAACDLRFAAMRKA